MKLDNPIIYKNDSSHPSKSGNPQLVLIEEFEQQKAVGFRHLVNNLKTIFLIITSHTHAYVVYATIARPAWREDTYQRLPLLAFFSSMSCS